MSTPSGIQGQLLEVTVVGCNKLRDTEWISRQDPYVCLEYANTKFRTRTCTDGHKNPTFQEKFVFSLIEGLRELNVIVWNSNTLTYDDFIGTGRVQLQKVLSQGYDDTPWPLQSKSGRYAGEVRLILYYANANSAGKLTPGYAPTAPPYVPAASHAPMYTTPPPSASPYMPTASYPSSPFPSYPQPPANPTAYPPSPYHAPPHPTAYPPQPQPTAYPPQPYPHTPYPPHTYPPPPQASPYYPPGPYPGNYPPPY